MRIGQTSVIYFLGKVTASVVGFLATIYFARVLGAEVLGFYAVAIAVAGWLKLGGSMGVSSAVQKRMSEGDDPDRYFVAGALMVAAFAAVAVSVLLLFRDQVNAYVGAEAALLVALLVTVQLLFAIVGAGLKGQRRVHVYGVLKPLKEASQSLTQVALVVPVLFGLGLTGLLAGKAIGAFLVTLLAIAVLGVSFKRPTLEHFKSLLDFAKYSWLGSVESRTFKEADIVIMGFFVSSALIGVYSIAWSLTMFLTLFGSSVRTTLFPEISNAASTKGKDAISLIEDGISYQGLILIPGFVGGTILSEQILQIYGDEFVQGTAVLWILILAVLLKGYQSQFLTALNGLDRPDISFYIYTAFILSNLILNVTLIYLFGWVGAAIATALSAGVGLSLSYIAVKRLSSFKTPTEMIAKQLTSALLMGIFVYAGLYIEQTFGLIEYNAITVGILVFSGALLYFVLLFVLSEEFRRTTRRNLPGFG
ncbi:probable flippase AglR [Natronomonas pharaonis DSM 2160]|uniref:Probable flippase AglR n=1 Tax=Natronomonas pharaonis (strain ATCC 35678 / DSM 2160 / CIP 103997 / JCM 8858 / NBRC 14720 / NCIMB 2260 / Gabara) TaxID=348780 RepID=A0A1U7EVL1_NATPD|nr:polysaccharide biosynthesis C-terminal domain-containing protein [Natronomonas pharaonis]CAI49063.1 probable flippase AglR [Natronomonas pharaonis DSM 2160]